MNEFTSLGIAVKELRELRGWSIRELARRSGISAAIISRLEAADDWNMTIRNVARIAEALGVTIGDLISHQSRSMKLCPCCGGAGLVTVSINGAFHDPVARIG